MASVIWWPTVTKGLSADFGFWKIMAISFPRTSAMMRSTCLRQPASSLESGSRWAGSRSREAARPLLPCAAFEDAVQPVAQQVKAEDGEQDRQRRRCRRPELALEKVVGPGLDHVAPRGRGLLHAKAEI